jgi:hypothetical protein
MKIALSLIFAFLSCCNTKAQEVDYNNLSKDIRWHRLLHYKSRWVLPGVKSFADSPKFFLSPEGRVNPEKELRAMSLAFMNPKKKDSEKWHPQCSFPARLKFLKEKTNLTFPNIKCEDFDWWSKRLNAKSLSLVFSSYFAGNPASMFGHTLLKLNSTVEGPGKISDFSVNFAADTGPDKGMLYIINGLFGGYYGIFSTEPYYNKINDYIQGESRDVWEYKLDANADHIDWIVKHLWELKQNSSFDYFFFDENCSYMLLTILEVGRLDWNLSHGMVFYALPVDTIKRVDQAGAIKEKYFRPSFSKKMEERYNRLSDKQKVIFWSLLNEKIRLEEVKDAYTLEAYSAYLRYMRYKDSNNKETVTQLKKKIFSSLAARAKLGGKTENIDPIIEKKYSFDDPRKSHHGYTVALSQGHHSSHFSYTDFHFRFALHDYFSNQTGLPPYSNLSFVGFKLRNYYHNNQFQLYEYTPIDLITLSDFERLTQHISWGIKVRGYIPQDYNSDHSLVQSVRPSVGLATYTYNKKIALFALLLFDMEYGHRLPKNNFRYGAGGSIGLLSHFLPHIAFNLTANWIYDFSSSFPEKQKWELENGISYGFGPALEVRAIHRYWSSSLIKSEYAQEVGLDLRWFF